jgi:hypothetical protein
VDIFISCASQLLKRFHGAGDSGVFEIMACATSFDSGNPRSGELIS